MLLEGDDEEVVRALGYLCRYNCMGGEAHVDTLMHCF